jgi:hypothetical protein
MSASDAMMPGRRIQMAIKTDEQARQSKAISGILLTVLVGRAGGSIEVTAEEFEAMVARYGGKGRATLIAERLEHPGGKTSFRMQLVDKRPAQGDLPV